MRKKGLAVLGLSGVLTLATSMMSFAQSDGVINYSDNFTKGEEVTAEIEEEYCSAAVNVFNDRNFTFSIDMNNLFSTRYNDIDTESYEIRSGVWIGFINEYGRIEPITKNPYTEIYVDVKEVSEGVYCLEGLDIKENVVYAIMAEVGGNHKPTSYSGGNAGGGVFSGVEPSYFKIVSSNTGNTDTAVTDTTSTDTAATSTANSGGGSDKGVYYYWMHNDIGWWVQCSDGTYLKNQWYLSPTSGLYYYLGADGYMLTNTTTPDGYYVNSEGVWIQ